MKHSFILIALLFFNTVFTQTFREALNMSGGLPPSSNMNGTNSYQNGIGNSAEWSKMIGMIAQFDDIDLEKRSIDGSVYLLDDWKNNAVVYVGNKKYLFNNMNFHIEKEVFMSKIEKDSTLIFDMNRLDRIEINNRQFKSIYTPNALS